MGFSNTSKQGHFFKAQPYIIKTELFKMSFEVKHLTWHYYTLLTT